MKEESKMHLSPDEKPEVALEETRNDNQQFHNLTGSMNSILLLWQTAIYLLELNKSSDEIIIPISIIQDQQFTFA